MSSNEEILKWRFDISTFRLIGRELITDRITALFELVKNSYDANAKRVNVIFKNITPISGIKTTLYLHSPMQYIRTHHDEYKEKIT